MGRVGQRPIASYGPTKECFNNVRNSAIYPNGFAYFQIRILRETVWVKSRFLTLGLSIGGV